MNLVLPLDLNRLAEYDVSLKFDRLKTIKAVCARIVNKYSGINLLSLTDNQVSNLRRTLLRQVKNNRYLQGVVEREIALIVPDVAEDSMSNYRSIKTTPQILKTACNLLLAVQCESRARLNKKLLAKLLNNPKETIEEVLREFAGSCISFLVPHGLGYWKGIESLNFNDRICYGTASHQELADLSRKVSIMKYGEDALEF